MLRVRQATIDDCYKLAPILRQADKLEIQNSSGFDPLTALLFSLQSNPFVIYHEDPEKPLGIFGAQQVGESVCKLWLVGSDSLFTTHVKTFIKQSKDFLALYHIRYSVIYNKVWAGNKVHIRWLKYMGFTFIREDKDYGPNSEVFYEFVRYV